MHSTARGYGAEGHRKANLLPKSILHAFIAARAQVPRGVSESTKKMERKKKPCAKVRAASARHIVTRGNHKNSAQYREVAPLRYHVFGRQPWPAFFAPAATAGGIGLSECVQALGASMLLEVGAKRLCH